MKTNDTCPECGVSSQFGATCNRCLRDRQEEIMAAEAETPLGEQIDGGNDEASDLAAEMVGEAEAARWDDDPNPYAGTFSED